MLVDITVSDQLDAQIQPIVRLHWLDIPLPGACRFEDLDGVVSPHLARWLLRIDEHPVSTRPLQSSVRLLSH